MIRLLLLLGVTAGCASGQTVSAPPQLDPASAGFSVDSLAALDRFLEERVADGAFPGGVLVVGTARGIVHTGTYGVYGQDDPRPVSDSTIYDLASLTKVVGLTTATLFLLADGRLSLDDTVQAILPEFTGAQKERITIRQLLTHTSGLPAWTPLYEETADRRTALERVMTIPLEHPPGSTYVYSDLGAITMTQIVEQVAGEPFDRHLERRLFQPLGMDDTGFLPNADLRPRIAPTERDPWRGRLVHGEVHDENTHHLGGVSGHAGLFSTGPDLARFATWLLKTHHGDLPPNAKPHLPADLVRRLTRVQPGPDGSTRAIGWDTPTPGGGISSGHRLSPSSFGHTGFTGTSIWIDPERDLFIILLTNRVHPTRENRALLPIRGQVADRVVGAMR